MTKYSAELKIEVVSSYLSGEASYVTLSKNKKYNINNSQIQTWVAKAKKNGLKSLKATHTKREYSVDL